jgi:hypothetical protein
LLTNPSAKYLVRLHGHRVALKDIPVGESVFFFLRDPCSRFVSGFYSRQRQGRPRHFTEWSLGEEAAFNCFDSANALAEALTSADPAVRASAEAAMQNIDHVRNHFGDWLGTPEYLRSRAADILFIGFQEQLDEDFSTLKALLGLASKVTLTTDERHGHRSPAHVDKSLSESALNNLRSWYASDYELLDLCRNLRLAMPSET